MEAETALRRTTHMGISAHQDDLEIMAIEGILACFQQDTRWFAGVVLTNGSGSPRNGVYERYTDEEMQVVRRKEQIKAAIVGEYGAQVLLDYSSAAIKDHANQAPVDDIAGLVRVAHPEVIYTHNLADKHETHVGVALKVIAALRSLPAGERPRRLYGCEVWRDLDWLADADKVVANCSTAENLQAALLGVFDSQISGGKRYDLAAMGRRRANATYFASHDTDVATGLTYAMDLTPLIEDTKLDVADYVESFIRRFGEDVRFRIQRLS
jgi:LmbE family N-acetylglucosaminyl deacetylase